MLSLGTRVVIEDESVSISGIKPEIVLSIMLAQSFFADIGMTELVISSGTEKYPQGDAIEVRTWSFNPDSLDKVKLDMSVRLGKSIKLSIRDGCFLIETAHK